jgi:hypothetical protein
MGVNCYGQSSDGQLGIGFCAVGFKNSSTGSLMLHTDGTVIFISPLV